jgi:hypothetical protein
MPPVVELSDGDVIKGDVDVVWVRRSDDVDEAAGSPSASAPVYEFRRWPSALKLNGLLSSSSSLCAAPSPPPSRSSGAVLDDPPLGRYPLNVVCVGSHWQNRLFVLHCPQTGLLSSPARRQHAPSEWGIGVSHTLRDASDRSYFTRKISFVLLSIRIMTDQPLLERSFPISEIQQRLRGFSRPLRWRYSLIYPVLCLLR